MAIVSFIIQYKSHTVLYEHEANRLALIGGNFSKDITGAFIYTGTFLFQFD